MRTVLSWSTGKDSAWALHTLRRRPDVTVVGLVTTINEAFDRVAMHGVRRELLEAQAAAAGLPLNVLLGVVAVAWFGLGHSTLGTWRVATFLTMFFLNAAIVGYYAAFARGFPAYARATGTGFVLGVGRLGAAGSPIIAGYLFTVLGNEQLLTVSLIMCLGAIFGAVLVWLVPLRDADADQAAVPQGQPID